MTPTATAALVATLAFAIGNWWSKVRPNRTLEYICKPATMVALIVVALSLDPANGAGDRRWWFVVALVLSLAGDVLLMLPSDAFVAGLAAFLLAHVAYIVGFWTDPPSAVAFVIAAIVVVVVVGALALRILRALASQPQFRVPVAAYMVVISTMVASAFASGIVVAAIGAALFAFSDTMIAWDRFVRPWTWSGFAIMVTYHAGQILLTLSLLAK